MTDRRPAARRTRLRRTRAAQVAVLAALPALAALLLSLSPPGMDPNADLPAFARSDPKVAEAYHFAASDKGWILQNIACYCGCGEHSGHASNFACFLKPNGEGFDAHGSQCQVCVEIALTAKQLYAAGSTLHDIRTAIDAKYVGYPGTPTPVPP